MSELNWDLLQPMRVAGGSHQKGSGYGCGMNVVSYINGDTEITDFPTCSDGKLSRLVQTVNDVLAVHGKSGDPFGIEDDNPPLLSPGNALAVIELGVLTMGTGTPHTYQRPTDEGELYEYPGALREAIRAIRMYSRMKHQMFCPCEGGTPKTEEDLRPLRDNMLNWAKIAILDVRREMGLDQAPAVNTAVLQENML